MKGTPSTKSYSNHDARRLAAVLPVILLCLLAERPAAAQGQGLGPPANQGRALTATLVQSLNFGNVGNNPSAPGSAIIDPASGTKTVTGGATDMGGVHSPAIFEIRGERLRSFVITLPVQITIAGPGGATATIDDFSSSPSLVGTLDNSGKAMVNVGATLQLSGSLANGAYTNLFDITVSYQ